MRAPGYARGWDELAAEDPFWAILFQAGQDVDSRAFLATGQDEVDRLLERAASLDRPQRFGTALDYGCGAGRLSRALAVHFERVIGMDISPEMIRLARELNADMENCEFEAVEPGQPLPRGQFDLVLSLLVLQHVPEAAERRALLRRLVAALREGGLLVVQATTSVPLRHRLQPRARLYTALRTFRLPVELLYRRLRLNPIRMAAIPHEDAVRIIEQEGGQVLDRIESQVSGVVSSTYFATTTTDGK